MVHPLRRCVDDSFFQGGWGTYLFGAIVWDGHWASTLVYNSRADVQSMNYFLGPWTSQPPRKNFTRWSDVFVGLYTWEGTTLQYHEFWYVWFGMVLDDWMGWLMAPKGKFDMSDRAQIVWAEKCWGWVLWNPSKIIHANNAGKLI